MTKVEILWERLTGLYGKQFLNRFGDEPTREWELVLSCVAVDAIAHGLDKLVLDDRYKTFPPSPMEFRHLCEPDPEDFGLPNTEEAFRQSLFGNSDKHPSVVYTLRLMPDVMSYKAMPEQKARKHFQDHWVHTIEHVRNGGELPRPEKQLEEKRCYLSGEENHKNMELLRQELKL